MKTNSLTETERKRVRSIHIIITSVQVHGSELGETGRELDPYNHYISVGAGMGVGPANTRDNTARTTTD